jgi:hypothetical protein
MRLSEQWAGVAALVVSLGLIGPQVARAEAPTSLDAEAPLSDAERPWAKGVPLATQETARAIFEEGNSLLKDSIFKSASQKYLEALKLWGHPGIHFNLALTLVSLEKPVEAYEHFKKAIAFGAAPLDEDKLARAKSYIALLEQQLATVRLSCNEPGAIVRLNGAHLFTAPGNMELKVKIGDNVFSATKPGFERTDISRMLKPKEVLELPLRVYHSEDLVVYKRKFAGWVPWVPMAAGALTVGGGVALGFASQGAYQKLDSEVGAGGGCAAAGAVQCSPSADQSALNSEADMLQTLSWVSYGVGGALVVTGLSLLIVNRPVAERATPDQLSRGVALLPWAGPNGFGFGARGQF